MQLVRSAGIIAIVLLLNTPTRAQTPERDRQAETEQLRGFLNGANEHLRDSAVALERDFKVRENSAFGGMLGVSEEVRKGILAAAESIKVHPAAEHAGALFARSEFQAALEACQTALRDDPTDPYALYLAGLCQIECGQFEAAAKSFDQAFAREPASRTSRLLAEFCRGMLKHQPPFSDEVILTCFDGARCAVEKELNLPPPQVFDFTGGPLVVDPLYFKVEAEAFAGHGPAGIVLDEHLTALAEKEPHAYYWLMRPATEDPAELRRSLGLSASDPECDAADFLAKYFADDSARDSDPPAYGEDVQKLCAAQPDDALWLLLRIPAPPRDRSLASAETDDGLKQFERAVAAPRMTIPMDKYAAAWRQVFSAARYPFADRVIASQRPQYNVVSRLGDLFETKLFDNPAACGDARRARLAAAAQGLAGRLVTQEPGLAEWIAAIRGGYRLRAAEVALLSQSLSPEQALESLSARCETQRQWALEQALLRLTLLGQHVPSPTICNTATRLVDGQWQAWKVQLARRCAAASDISKEAREALETLPGERRAAGHLCVESGALGFRELMPRIRRLRHDDCCLETLYDIVWATGELGGPDDVPWLIECLEKPPAWLPLAAAVSLRRITGQDYGTDPAAWRRALGDQQ